MTIKEFYYSGSFKFKRDGIFEESSQFSLHRVLADSTEQECISSHSEGYLFQMEGIEIWFYFGVESLESREVSLWGRKYILYFIINDIS